MRLFETHDASTVFANRGFLKLCKLASKIYKSSCEKEYESYGWGTGGFHRKTKEKWISSYKYKIKGNGGFWGKARKSTKSYENSKGM